MAAAGDDLDVHIRVLPPEFLQQVREDVQADRHPADQAQSTGELLLRIENALGGVADVGEHAVAELQQRFARRRDLDPPAIADEERLLELFLEQEDLAADGRLRDVQARAGGVPRRPVVAT